MYTYTGGQKFKVKSPTSRGSNRPDHLHLSGVKGRGGRQPPVALVDGWPICDESEMVVGFARTPILEAFVINKLIRSQYSASGQCQKKRQAIQKIEVSKKTNCQKLKRLSKSFDSTN